LITEVERQTYLQLPVTYRTDARGGFKVRQTPV